MSEFERLRRRRHRRAVAVARMAGLPEPRYLSLDDLAELAERRRAERRPVSADCERCGAEFVPRDVSQRFCAAACRNRAQQDRDNERRRDLRHGIRAMHKYS